MNQKPSLPQLSLFVSRVLTANSDLAMTQALKARARELQRLGLAKEIKRNVLAFEPDWRDRLTAMELHLNIRKRIVRERTLNIATPKAHLRTIALRPERDIGR